MSNTLHVSFDVTIAQDKYSYDKTGRGEISIDVPENLIKMIEAGSLFSLALEAALNDYNAKIVTAAIKEEEGE